MALNFLSKLKQSRSGGTAGGGSGPNAGDGSGNDDHFKRDAKKAAKFFKHGETMADSRQFDYAIECYINGLRFDADNMARHEELREVAKRRKVVAGGKAAGLKEKLVKTGKGPIDRMLHEEMLWSKSPLDGTSAAKVMERAVDANEQVEDVDLSEFAYWVGDMALQHYQGAKKPSKSDFIKLCELFSQIAAFDKAVEACRYAMTLDPKDDNLAQLLKDLEAEQMMHQGSYGTGKEGDFRENIKDEQLQRNLEAQDAITQTESTVETNIRRWREEFEKNPEDLDRLNKYVAALLQKKDSDAGHEAIKLLAAAHEKTGQYKFKVQIGDIKIRDLRRKLGAAEKKHKGDPSNAQARKQYKKIRAEKEKFELEEYIERANNYPTDLRVRFDLGVRYLTSKKYDEAIGEFQKAQADPKHRATSYAYLGQCFMLTDLIDEAINTLKMGIEAHPLHDDKLGLELRYLLMNGLEKSAQQTKSLETATEAQKMASQILQTDIGYRDIRQRMSKIKKLVTELQPS